MKWKYFRKKNIIVQQQQYQIKGCIGEGSHATIWLARARLYPHDEIIIKIAKQTKEICHERVQNEIWFLKEVSHPHIPSLLDHGIVEEHLWLAMDVFDKLQIHVPVKGKLIKVDISNIEPQGYPSKAKKIPLQYREKTAIAVLLDISKVILYLSDTGIVHADISPGNIMQKRGSLLNKQYMLTDWGATALIHRYPEDSFGSLHFTAPERLWGQVGYKSDLFSIGIIGYYILTGNVPFSGSDGDLYYLSVVERDGSMPSDLESSIVPALDKLIRDLIRQRPEDRPEPANVFKRIEKLYNSYS